MLRKPIRPKPIPLTPAIIADMTPGEDRGDAQCPGLRVRCSASGKKRFFYRYRARDGVLREIKLGDVGSPLTLAKARDAVARKKLERAEGKDPQLEERKAKADAMRERIAKEQAAYTLEDMVNEYIEEVLDGQKRGAIEQGRLPDEFISPTIGIKGAPQVRRKRVLTDAELAIFMKWLPGSPYSRNVRDAMSLVLFTGCRSGEVVAALWRDIDLDRGVWTIRVGAGSARDHPAAAAHGEKRTDKARRSSRDCARYVERAPRPPPPGRLRPPTRKSDLPLSFSRPTRRRAAGER